MPTQQYLTQKGKTMPARKNTPSTPDAPAENTQPDATGLTSDTPDAQGQQGNGTPAAELSADFLSAPVILDMSAAPEYVKQSAPVRARSERQQAMDKTVADLHERWVKAGSPSQWGAMVNAKVVATYFVEPAQAETLKKSITRAKLLHGIAIKWGSEFVATPEMIQRFNLPAEYEGRTVISFAAKTKRPRATDNGVTTSQAPANGADDDDDDDDDDDE